MLMSFLGHTYTVCNLFSFFSFLVFLCFLTLLRLSAGTISSVIKCSEREYRSSTLEVLFPENYSTVAVVTCYPRTSNYYGRENRHRVDFADLFGLPFLLKFPPPFAVDRFYRLQSLLRALYACVKWKLTTEQIFPVISSVIPKFASSLRCLVPPVFIEFSEQIS